MNKKSISKTIWSILPWLAFFGLIFIIFRLGIDISAKKNELAAAKESAIKPAPVLTNIVIQTIKPIRMEDKINLPAVTKAWQDLMIKTEVAGKVVSLKITEGEMVAKNQTLALIDPSDYKNSYDTVNARYTLAKANYQRLKKLRKKSAISTASYDEAHAVLVELEAALADATLKLQRCTITAPFAGIINTLPAKEGMLLAYADPVAQILDISRLKLDVAIPESAVASLKTLKECTLTFAALSNRQIVGTKNFLASQPSSAAMSYSLQLALKNDNLDILPGMFARANIIKGVFEEAVGIPLYAVLNQDDSKFVYVIRDNIATKREISTGFLEGWKVQVTAGLKPGEQIAIVGQRGLANGQKVKIVKRVTDPGEITR